MGAQVTFDYQWGPQHAWRPHATAPGSRLLKAILGEYYKANVVEIQLFAGPGMSPERFVNSHAQQMAQFSELRWLVLMDTKMTDAGLAHFACLRKLERLDIEGSPVTTSGVQELRQRLPKVAIYCSDSAQ